MSDLAGRAQDLSQPPHVVRGGGSRDKKSGKSTSHVLLLGFGQLNQALAISLAAQGYRITAVSRHAKPIGHPQQITQVLGDLTSASFLQTLQSRLEFDPPQASVIAVTPDGRSNQDYKQSYLQIARCVSPMLASLGSRVLQVSSTGVYGFDSAEHLTELSPAAPITTKSKLLFATERVYRAALGARLCTVRASGIYSSDRDYMVRAALDLDSVQANQWGNRIHQADLVRVLEFALDTPVIHPVLLATDQLPATKAQVVNWIREAHGLSRVSVVAAGASGKRLRSVIVPERLYEYPDFRRGYLSVIMSGSGRCG